RYESKAHRFLQPLRQSPIPFTGSIHGGLQEGKSIIISGRVIPGVDRFNVNLQCGSRSGADIAFHFNPRYDGHPYVVTNSFQYGNWGSEERKQNAPLPAGSNFTLQITVTRDFYQVRPSRENLFLSQSDFQDLKIGKSVYNSYSVFAESVLTFSKVCSSFLTLKTFSAMFCFPLRFHMNLTHQSGIALHYNPRFNENVVVRNTKQWDKWGSEERGGGMPFHRGQPFTNKSFRLVVNGMQAHNYNHRFTPLQNITGLEIEGDVQLTSVIV
uniref:Galectin n=1 Tax=Xiphophorus couchianus TaxID=32473 RepID=A0A3B5M7V4_9TELE